MGFEHLRWIRGNISFLLLGRGTQCPGDFLVLDRDKQKASFLMSTTKRVVIKDVDQEIDQLLSQNIVHTDAPTKVTLVPAKNWFWNDREELVGIKLNLDKFDS